MGIFTCSQSKPVAESIYNENSDYDNNCTISISAYYASRNTGLYQCVLLIPDIQSGRYLEISSNENVTVTSDYSINDMIDEVGDVIPILVIEFILTSLVVTIICFMVYNISKCYAKCKNKKSKKIRKDRNPSPSPNASSSLHPDNDRSRLMESQINPQFQQDKCELHGILSQTDQGSYIYYI